MEQEDSLRVAVVQLRSTPDVERNLDQIRSFCANARKAGVSWVCLPENAAFLGFEGEAVQFAAPLDESHLVRDLGAIARAENVVLFVGSIPEASDDPGRAYNCSVVLGRDGKILAKYRKVHLFDVELPGGTAIRESDGWVPGDETVCVDVDGWKVGLSICYDLRFPEHYRRLIDAGAEVLMVPSAFTLQTGKDHWSPLLRARAIENQCYVVAAAQWGEHFEGRVSWGKSMVVDPWGIVLATAAERTSWVMADLDRQAQRQIRSRLPALRHRRC